MCGIFGYVGNNNRAADIVLEGLKSLEYRGYDSWGIAALISNFQFPISKNTDNHISAEPIIIKKRVGKIGDANVDDLPDSYMALGHTRWATHGGVSETNAHPHKDCTGSLAIIHNGIIENYDEIKEELLQKGHKFVSETDTEVAVHLIEEYYIKHKTYNIKHKTDEKRKLLLDAVRRAFKRFEGLNAIIVMDGQSESFIAAKNGSPLAAGKGPGENLLASDAHGLLPYTKDVYFMEDDEILYVDMDGVKAFDARDGLEKKIAFTKLAWNIDVPSKGTFDHFMMKEIADQTHTIAAIAKDVGSISKFAKIISQSFGTYLVGCGTAAYACLSGTYIFSKIAKIHVNFSVGSEFGYLVDFLTNKSLIIALSQSGETIDVIDAVKRARDKGAQIGCLTNVLGSTLFRFSDHKLLLNAGVETAVVSTKAFTAKIAYLLCIAHHLSKTSDTGIKDLVHARQEITRILEENYLAKIKTLSRQLSTREHIYVVGRGVSYPIALETALKIKEASYIHAEGFAAGELKHGVIALIEKGTPCIAFLPNDETYGAALAGVMEMKARGGYIIGVSSQQHEVFDYYLPLSDCGSATLIPSAVVGQLLGYYLAISRNLDPDKPRNLAKSVTVK